MNSIIQSVQSLHWRTIFGSYFSICWLYFKSDPTVGNQFGACVIIGQWTRHRQIESLVPPPKRRMSLWNIESRRGNSSVLLEHTQKRRLLFSDVATCQETNRRWLCLSCLAVGSLWFWIIGDRVVTFSFFLKKILRR